MTCDFKLGKAYLIEGKDIEQVKSEIKEWSKDNNLEVVIDKDNEIAGDKRNFFPYGYEIWIHVKLVSHHEGTLVVFNNEFKKYFTDLSHHRMQINIGIGSTILEIRKNLIRYLEDKPEIKININRPYSTYMGFLIEIVIPMYFIVYFLEPYFPNIIGTVSIIPFLLLFLIPTSYKLNIQKQANLPEYKIEEYKGEIEID